MKRKGAKRVANPITTISLCTGVGWLDEGVGAGCRYLGWGHRVAAYCEWEAYAQAVLLARMEESSMEPAPVWGGDLGQFDGRAFRGTVDGITAGFPCQPWSAAGKQLGTDDDRWLWPAIVRIIVDVRPRFVFLENVSALIAGGGLEQCLSDLAKMGFDAEWCCLTAEAVGAAHRRERVFILAYSEGFGEREPDEHDRGDSRQRAREVTGGGSGELDDASRDRPCESGEPGEERPCEPRRRRIKSGGRRAALADAIKPVVQQAEAGCPGVSGGTAAASADISMGNAASESAQGRRGGDTDQRIFGSTGGSLFAPGPGADWTGIPEALWPATERGVRVLVDGSAVVLDESRADQLRCSGNGVVALCAATAFVELVRRILKRDA